MTADTHKKILGRAKKSLGQHFLTNRKVAENIVSAAEVTDCDTVFEIGPGTGMLTRELLHTGAHIVALEADFRAVTALRETFKKELRVGQLLLIHGDVRHTEVRELELRDKKFKIVANIPYYISGMLFKKLLSGKDQPTSIAFLVQKEVAERIARSKKESLLSLSVKAFGTPQYVKTVSRSNFAPQPTVDSAILAIKHISRDRFENLDEEFFFMVLRAGFAARRKQLAHNLSSLLDRAPLLGIFQTLHLREDVRGEDIGIHAWCDVAAHVQRVLSTRQK